MMPIKIQYLIIIIIFAIFFCILFYPRLENYFVFFPQKAFDFRPDMYGLYYQDVYFDSEDGTELHGWFFPVKETSSPTLLFCHGNAGNISHRLENIKMLIDRNVQVFIFDYRGYGRSSGKPSEKGIYLDGHAAYDYLVRSQGIKPDNIILFGRSLGAAVAISLALEKEARSIIIESAFTSLKDMAETLFLFKVVSPFIPKSYNNLDNVKNIRIPKLIMHGEKDEIVPAQMGKKLFAEAMGPKYFYLIERAGHNDTYFAGGDEYFEKLLSFINDSVILP